MKVSNHSLVSVNVYEGPMEMSVSRKGLANNDATAEAQWAPEVVVRARHEAFASSKDQGRDCLVPSIWQVHIV